MKVQLPIVGHASGRNGNLIYQTYNGATYVRTTPAIFHYPRTPAQAEQSSLWLSFLAEWQMAYSLMSPHIPQAQRKGRNVFDVLTRQLWQIHFAPRDESYYRFIESWGIDERKEVVADLEERNSAIRPDVVAVHIVPHSIVSTRKFEPLYWFVFAVKPASFEYYTSKTAYNPYGPQIVWPNTLGWQSTDTVYFFAALYNNEFFSNFFLPVH